MFSDFFPKNRAVSEIMSKRVVEPEDADNMALSCGIPDKDAYTRGSTRPRSCIHCRYCVFD